MNGSMSFLVVESRRVSLQTKKSPSAGDGFGLVIWLNMGRRQR